jgi:hypothetical protein
VVYSEDSFVEEIFKTGELLLYCIGNQMERRNMHSYTFWMLPLL